MNFQSHEPVDQHHATHEVQSNKQQRNWWDWMGLNDKTLWNYLDLLIVSLLLLGFTTGMSQYQNKVDK